MNHLLSLFAAFVILTNTLLAQTTTKKNDLYLNQELPGLVPVIFAPDLVSLKNRYEYGSVFSKDGKEFYYAVIVNGKPQIQCSRYDNNSWTSPKTVIGSVDYEYNDPFLSPDEQRLYFISDQNKDGKGEKKDFDIWYLERKNDRWSQTPINAGPNINTEKNEYYMSFTQSGTMYFSSNGYEDQTTGNNYDIRLSHFPEGAFKPSVKLANAVNSEQYEADVFVAPDEQYIIFCSERLGGLGKGDLYISFKNKQGKWEMAKNMGNAINTEGYEFCPFVTSDGNHLFFSRDGDIYWLQAEVINSLR